jgi:hypothetical protein
MEGKMMENNSSEILREVASKLWHAPLGKIVEGLAGPSKRTKVVLVKTPLGIITVIFMLGEESIHILIRGGNSGHFLFEMNSESFFDELNKEKKLKEIAHLSVDWSSNDNLAYQLN